MALSLDMSDVQDRAAAWVLAKFPESTQADRLAKLLEEAGEFARACIGQYEQRPGRGDVGVEAAQTVLVIASLIGRYFPDIDLFAEVRLELARAEDALALDPLAD
jgi:hypothetical protein